MRILVLGGTRNLGRAVVDAALGRGDQVTLFNRGTTNPGLYPGLETIIGDRTADLSALAGRGWDAVVDVAGYHPEVVRRSAEAIDATRYVFVSSVSVYASHRTSQAQAEDAPVLELSDDTPEELLYGARKAAAERIVTSSHGSSAHIARAGVIVGPHDPTDRFAYWPRRIVRGGTVLAPGDPADLVQVIDVRDLGAWLADACHRPDLGGVYNVTGQPIPFKELLDGCLAATGGDATIRWLSSDELLAKDVNPWMGVPMWIAAAQGWEAGNDVDTAKARQAGLRIRPLLDTIRDTLAWDLARGGPAPGNQGLSAAEEARILARLTRACWRSPYSSAMQGS
jgi:2'-hydroxyisoflavone reductase